MKDKELAKAMQHKKEYLPEDTPQLAKMRMMKNLKQNQIINEKLNMKKKAKSNSYMWIVIVCLITIVIVVALIYYGDCRQT